jgi:hypothetical protein
VFLGGLVIGSLQISIRLSGTPDTHPGSSFSVEHRPGWKVYRSVCASLKDTVSTFLTLAQSCRHQH